MPGAIFRSGLGLALVVAWGATRARAQADGTALKPYTTLSSSIPGTIVGGAAVDGEGTLYIGLEVGTSSGRMLPLKADGTLKWPVPPQFNDWVDSTPAISDDGTTLYFGCWNGNLFALNTADGAVQWVYSTDAFIASSPAIGTDGTIYVGSGDGSLHAVNPDGSEKWVFPTGDWVDSSPAIGPDGTIYVGSWDSQLYAVTPDGQQKWAFATNDAITGSPAVAADGTIYVGSRDEQFYAVNADGSLRWSFATDDVIEASPVIGPDGTVYVAATDGHVYALKADGTERWRYPASGASPLQPLYATPAVRADGSIILGTSDNESLLALNPDGTLRWESTLGDATDSPAVVTFDGRIYLGCADKKIHRFTSRFGPSMADWPMLHRDPRRTGRQPLGAAAGTTGGLANLSVRTMAGTGANTLITGFVVAGAGDRTLLVRGVGPTLAAFGVTGVLADPVLTVYGPGGVVAANDNWSTAVNASQVVATAATVGAFALPNPSLDAAIRRDFGAGAFTAQVSGAGSTGIALTEIYDAGGTTARLTNISARSLVISGAGVLIGGFVIKGGSRALLVRGVGPTLGTFGVPGALADPVMRVYRGDEIVAENNDWAVASNAADLAAQAAAVGAFALPEAGSLDAAMLLTLPAGAYTVQVAGADGGTGVALVEIYEVP